MSASCSAYDDQLIAWMIGWFRRRAQAARKQRIVVVPTIGLTAMVRPMATVSAIFSGESPG